MMEGFYILQSGEQSEFPFFRIYGKRLKKDLIEANKICDVACDGER